MSSQVAKRATRLGRAQRSGPLLALLGGRRAVTRQPGDLFTWPILTRADEAAVLDVLRRREMSGTAITREFEREFARWMGVDYALGTNNGTAALLAAMFGVGIGVGDEIICPSITYWASALPVFSLGGTVVFADVDPRTLCIDPRDIERRISKRTRAIVVVHYLGHPADMDAILAVARRHRLRVIEDVSHAQGALFKGRRVGSFGDVAAYSLMTAKALATGEAGMLTTGDRTIYERATAFGHYERFDAAEITSPELRPFAGLPLGGCKHRMHQMSAAMGRVQLRHYDRRCAEIRRAMNLFWDLLEGVPGIRPHRVDEAGGDTMGGWYCPHGFFVADELGGLSLTRFCEAVRAEGVPDAQPGCNRPLHLHPLLNTADFLRHGRPTRIANAVRDLRQPPGSLPVAEGVGSRVFGIPWFKHCRPAAIREYAEAFRKVAMNAEALVPGDRGNPVDVGGWNLFKPAPPRPSRS